MHLTQMCVDLGSTRRIVKDCLKKDKTMSATRCETGLVMLLTPSSTPTSTGSLFLRQECHYTHGDTHKQVIYLFRTITVDLEEPGISVGMDEKTHLCFYLDT